MACPNQLALAANDSIALGGIEVGKGNYLEKNDGLEKGGYLEENNYRERDSLGCLEDKIVAAAVGAEVARYIEKYPGKLEGKIGVRNAGMEQKWDWRAISPNPDWALALSKGNLLAQLQKKAAINKPAVGKVAAGIGEAGKPEIGRAAAGIGEAGDSVRRKTAVGRDAVGKGEDEKTEKLLQQRAMATREQKRWLQEKQMYAAISGNIDRYRCLPQSFESGRIPAADAQKLACRKWQPTQFPKNNVDSILPGALKY